MATKWGIAGCGLIANDFVNALSTLPADEHKVVAVAARTICRAEKFAEKYSISKAYSSYEQLADDPDVEVIYVATNNPTHRPLVKLFLDHGKPVLCEKPLGMNIKETVDMIELAKKKDIFLMEAIWSRCLPSYKALSEEINKGAIGDIKQVIATFGQVIDVPCIHEKALGGSFVLDLGVYAVAFAQLVFGGEEPKSITAAGHLGPDGVDESASVTLLYENGRTATLVTHSRVNLPGQAHVIGTKGTLTLEYPFWSSTCLRSQNDTIQFQVPEGAKHKYNFTNSGNLSFEAAHVRDCLAGGLKESPLLALKETLAISNIMESIRSQIGVTFPQDD